MYYCFLAEDIIGLKYDPLIIQKKYAERLDMLCIGYLNRQIILNSLGNPVALTGQKVILRCTYDNLSLGLQLLSAHGAELIETQNDVNQIMDWYKLGITRRKIYELSLADIITHCPTELRGIDKIFLKSKVKGFSAVIALKKIIQHDSQVMDFLKTIGTQHIQKLLISKYIPIKEDSLGTRETRHVILNNQVVNSSRLLYSLKHTVPKSHKLKAQEIVDLVKKIGTFPSNYILDLGDFIDDNCSYLDIVEYNPLSCSMCFVNNSIFDIAVPEIEEKYKQLQMGFEFCYDALSSPQRYELTRASNKKYTYVFEKRYFFL